MPIAYAISDDHRFIFYRISGLVSVDTVKLAMTELVDNLRPRTVYNEILVFDTNTDLNLLEFEIQKYLLSFIRKKFEDKNSKVAQSALVCDNEISIIALRLWQALADKDEKVPTNYRVFPTLPDAADWVGVDINDYGKLKFRLPAYSTD